MRLTISDDTTGIYNVRRSQLLWSPQAGYVRFQFGSVVFSMPEDWPGLTIIEDVPTTPARDR